MSSSTSLLLSCVASLGRARRSVGIDVDLPLRLNGQGDGCGGSGGIIRGVLPVGGGGAILQLAYGTMHIAQDMGWNASLP